MLEVPEHYRTRAKDGGNNEPKTVLHGVDWIAREMEIEYRDEEREREGEERHNSEDAHRFVLFCGEERIVGLAKLVE